jgi:hypothetical protein
MKTLVPTTGYQSEVITKVKVFAGRWIDTPTDDRQQSKMPSHDIMIMHDFTAIKKSSPSII